MNPVAGSRSAVRAGDGGTGSVPPGNAWVHRSARRPAERSPADLGWGTELGLIVALIAAMAVSLAFRPARPAIAGVIALTFVGLAFTRLELAITLLLLYLVAPPLVTMTSIGGIPGLNAETIMFGVLLAATLQRHRSGGVGSEQAVLPRRGNPVAWPLLIFACLALISAFISPMWRVPLVESLTGAKQFLTPVLFVPIILGGIRTREEATRLFYGFLAVVGFLTAYAIRDVAHGMVNPRFRLDTFIGHPNEFGALLVLCTCVIATAVFAPGAPRPLRMILLWLTFACMVSLMWTLSRGSILGMIAGLVVAGVIYSRKFLVALLLALALAPWWVPERVIMRFQETREEGTSGEFGVDGSTAVRIDQWTSLPEMMAGSPVFGHGFDTFGPVNRYRGTMRWQGAHSSWVRLLVEQGILGLSAIVWALAAAWFAALQVMRRGEDFLSQALGPGMVAALPAVFVVNASGQRLYHEVNSSFLWLLIALLLVCWRMLPAEGKPSGAAVPARPGGAGFIHHRAHPPGKGNEAALGRGAGHGAERT